MKYGFRSRGREDPACSTSDSMGRATEGGVLRKDCGNKTLRLNTLTKHKGGGGVFAYYAALPTRQVVVLVSGIDTMFDYGWE